MVVLSKISNMDVQEKVFVQRHSDSDKECQGFNDNLIQILFNYNCACFTNPGYVSRVKPRFLPADLPQCKKCPARRPPRTHHCSSCGQCVLRMDHHCPWVGNCVGKRNYRYFYFFLLSLALHCVFIFACAVTHLVLLTRQSDKAHGPFIEAVKQSPTSLIVCIICFFSVWSILGLAGFHT